MLVSNHYRVFTTPEKFVRTGIIRQILDDGGYAEGTYYVGEDRIARAPAKVVEELSELMDICNKLGSALPSPDVRTRLLKEASDVGDALWFLKRKLSSGLPDPEEIAEPAQALELWKTYVRDLQPNQKVDLIIYQPELFALANATFRGIEVWTAICGLGIDEVHAAGASKARKLGSLEGWTLRKVGLRPDSRWLYLFSPESGWTETEEVLNFSRAFTHDTINAVTPRG